MLTKQEMSKKKSYASDLPSEEVVDTSELKLKKKRFFIILSIALTIGLSLVFIIYRQVKDLIANPQLAIPKLPQLSLNKPVITSSGIEDLTAAISQIITIDEAKWNIVVANSQAVYNWPSNRTHLDQSQAFTLTKNLSKLPPSNLLADLLPLGLIVREESSSSPNQQKLTAAIYPPTNEPIFFELQFEGKPEDFQKTITDLIPTIYWSTISRTGP